MKLQSTPAAAAEPKFDSPEQEAFLQLWRTYDCLKAFEDELLGRYELSAQQYNALRLLQAALPGGLQTMELSRRLISRSPDITRMLDRLETRGLIARQRLSDNRRVVEVVITDAGRKLVKELALEVLEMHRRQIGHLGLSQQRQLIKLLKAARAPHEAAARAAADANA